MSSLSCQSPSISTVLVAPLEAGVLANTFLTGTFFVQAYVYFTRFSEDKWPFKTVLGNCASEGAFLWDMTILALKSPLDLLTLPNSMMAVIVMINCTALLVQACFCALLCENWSNYIQVVFRLSTVEDLKEVLGPHDIGFVLYVPPTDLMVFWTRIRTTTTVTFSIVFASDLWITLATSYYLQKSRRSSAFSPTNLGFVFNRLTIWTIGKVILASSIRDCANVQTRNWFMHEKLTAVSMVLLIEIKRSFNHGFEDAWTSAFCIYGSARRRLGVLIVTCFSLHQCLNGGLVKYERSLDNPTKIQRCNSGEVYQSASPESLDEDGETPPQVVEGP
ncbi:hypothetical protein CONPUDRAFT_77837 [Coniophora puteana RWD-64-598 SS2]|uniref:Uncharacterized protein n=1 Tax=Coniophora puteana (strain RWD-64-598) TaxID=741705 RepID=R7SF81_CONPW|nr:uncharacterized protein CONPUDRAFT_77837 [Coniophora puteana RWD-64-598 SS2]EIW74535.1 hypothetical protein CONPUDRAFT_77837 [Coniophora puteana RWD-64-598 SS2]